MLEYAILGAIQGIVDWLPVSSEGAVVLAYMFLFPDGAGLGEMIRVALFLHIGSLLAVVVYFRKELFKLLSLLWNYRQSSREDQALFNFLIISSVVTGILGYAIFHFIDTSQQMALLTGSAIMLGIGALLLFTSWLQFRAKRASEQKKERGKGELSFFDSLLLGVIQALAVLPGLSRSGSTISVLLLRKINESDALKVSFFMSLPVIIGGNIILNWQEFVWGSEKLIGLLVAFLVGLATIHLLLKVAEKLSFAWFTLFFGLLTIAGGLFSLL